MTFTYPTTSFTSLLYTYMTSFTGSHVFDDLRELWRVTIFILLQMLYRDEDWVIHKLRKKNQINYLYK